MKSWDDITMISHAILGGNYKRRAHLNLGAVIWVFWHWRVGSIDKSQTLYSGYLSASCEAEHNQNELCVSFIHMHVPRPFGDLFSQYDFSCLTLARKVTTCIPLNLVLSEAQITTLWQQIVRGDKLLVCCESLSIHLVYLCTTCHISGIPGWAQPFSTLPT